MHHVSGPVGLTGGPKTKSFQGEKFETEGFNIFQGKISSKGMAMRGKKGDFFAETPSEVGQMDGPKKSFYGGAFETGGFNIFQGKISISKGTAVRGEKER